MSTQNLLKQISALAEELASNDGGFNPEALLEAVHTMDFSEAVDGASLLEELKQEGLL